MRDLVSLAFEFPELFMQLYYDMQLESTLDGDGNPSWRKPGERAVDARDRLRAERDEYKRRVGA